MPDLSSIQLPVVYSESAHFLVEPMLEHVQFGCDLTVCKGACCTMPAAAGAPILESEIAELERVFPFVEKYLQEDAHEVIAKKGIWERDFDGALTIPAIRGRDCIFVCYENDDADSPKSPTSDRRRGQASPTMRGGGADNKGIAYCAIEKAHRVGEITGFPKPISCHLFPIRIYPTYEDGTYSIVYEEIPECKGARARGKREKIPVLDFLTSPLVRALGEERVERLRRALRL